MCVECGLGEEERDSYFQDVEIEDNGVYKFTCMYGHERITLLQKHKFQMLFDLGIMALIDGYTREAVSSFSSAIERFYEFCIEVLLEKNQIDHQDYLKTWKFVASQSERQIGAFYFLYLNEFNKAPEKIKDNWVTFRNNVIHKGHIPKYDKVMEYAKYVFDYLKSILVQLKMTHSDHLFIWFEKRQQEFQNGNPSNSLAVLVHPGLIDPEKPLEELITLTFEKAIEDMKKRVEKNYNV